MMGRVGMLLGNAVIARRYVAFHILKFYIMWPCRPLAYKNRSDEEAEEFMVLKLLRLIGTSKVNT
jgi:hypothetical protein